MTRDELRDRLEGTRFYVRWTRKLYAWSPRRHGKKWKQRAQRGWSLEDTFDFDGYLARVIAGGVAEIRHNLHGYPPELGAPAGNWSGNPMEELDDEQGMAAWGSILDKIVEGFTIYAEEGGYPVSLTDDPEANASAAAQAAKIDQAKRLFVYWYGHLWD